MNEELKALIIIGAFEAWMENQGVKLDQILPPDSIECIEKAVGKYDSMTDEEATESAVNILLEQVNILKESDENVR
ncbi:hypothetical protein [Paenibacillus sp. MMO-177]|uniref:hypothetical protein n=1 Tax=Paenibacillus sp. MMO-177 TaxID=3081289 RepID=UPI00301B6A96